MHKDYEGTLFSLSYSIVIKSALVHKDYEGTLFSLAYSIVIKSALVHKDYEGTLVFSLIFYCYKISPGAQGL